MPTDSPEAAQLPTVPLEQLETFFASEKGQELIARAVGEKSFEGIDPDRIYPTKEAARLVGLAPNTLMIHRMQGKGMPYVKPTKNRVGYTGRAILAERKKNTRRSTTEEK